MKLRSLSISLFLITSLSFQGQSFVQAAEEESDDESIWVIVGNEVKKVLEGKIKRSCEANYLLEVDDRELTLGDFSARRGCGQFVPNRCRRRARDAAHLCMNTHWESRDGSATPRECQYNGVKDYNITNLSTAIRDKVCALPVASGRRTVTVNVSSYTKGDKGCGPREDKSMKKSLGRLEVNCQTQ